MVTVDLAIYRHCVMLWIVMLIKVEEVTAIPKRTFPFLNSINVVKNDVELPNTCSDRKT